MSAEFVAALLEERRGYVQREDSKRLAAVDAELDKLGVSVADDGTVDLPADVTLDDEVVPPGYETTDADLSEVETATRKPTRPAAKAKAATKK